MNTLAITQIVNEEYDVIESPNNVEIAELNNNNTQQTSLSYTDQFFQKLTNGCFNWGANGSQPVTLNKYEAYIFN
jgi:hypothetical protein